MLSCSITVLRYPSDVNLRSGKLPNGGVVTGEIPKAGDYVGSNASWNNGGVENNKVTLFVGVFGDTAGAISIWLLPGSIVPSEVQVRGTVRYVLVTIRQCLPLRATTKRFHIYRQLHSVLTKLIVL